MSTYTKVYNNPYPDGWKDGKDGNTPVTADILNNQTETIESIEQYLADNPIEQGGSGTGGTTDYEALENKPTINGVEVVGDLSLEDLGITGGGGSGTTNYEDLTNKPSINGTELSGDITLDIPTKTSDLTNDSGFLTEIPEQSYNDLSDKPQINGIDLQGNLTVEELGLLDITESTDTTLENSKDGILKIKEIYGNTEQSTTSGKNLLDCSGLKEQTVAGVTFTPVFDNSGLLEYINVNGANDGTSNSNYHLSAGKFSLTGGKTYKVTGCPSTGSDTTYGFGVSHIGSDFGSGRIGTPAQDYTDAYVSISVFKGVTVSNVKFYPMIRYAENGDDTYEPFTDGASPNPDYPQEIESVVISEMKTCGKNLLNQSSLLQGTISANDGYTIGTSTSILYSPYFTKLKRGESYIFNIRNSIRIYKYDKYKKFIESVIVTNAFIADCEYIRYQSNNFTEENQLEIGTVSTEYEPHTESKATLSAPITLNGIGDVSDYIDVKRGVEHHKFSYERVLGSNITSVDASEAYGSIIVSNIEGKSKGLSLSDRFIGINYNDRIENTDTFRCYLDENKKLIFRPAISENANFADLATVRAYFDNNEVYAAYELSEPIETPLPEADAEALKLLKTYDGVTHIFTDSEVAPIWLVEYNTTRVGTELDEIDAELAKINKRITDIGTTAQINYSTEEQVIGTWIDGRPIYQKTITDYDILNTANGTVLVAENIDFLISQPTGTAKFVNALDGSLANAPLPQVASISDYAVGANATSNGYVSLDIGEAINKQGNYSSAIATITFQYTKTTDTV